MILPDKTTRPIDSLISIGGEVMRHLRKSDFGVDELYIIVASNYRVPITLERFILCLDFLFLVNLLEINDENLITHK